MKSSHLKRFVVVGILLSSSGVLAGELPEDLAIVDSDPPANFVDSCQDRHANSRQQGIRVVHLVFDQPVALELDDLRVLTTGSHAPAILALNGEDENWTVLLDGPLPAGEASAISIGKGLCWVAFGSLPGDVNGDLVSDQDDVSALQDAIAAGSQDPQYDIDRDGEVNTADLDRLAVILSGSDGGRAWQGEIFDVSTMFIVCCCSAPPGICSDTMPNCPQGWQDVPCPCTLTSCPPF